jgi:3-methyladenine DNA glycosylase AlkD
MKAFHLYQVLKKEFESNSDSARANAMSKYMRNLFVFYGIPTPLRIEITKKALIDFNWDSKKELQKFVELCYEQEEREWQYTAIYVFTKFKKEWEETYIELIEQCIIQKSWWDTVDLLASNCAGFYFTKYPNQLPSKISTWRQSENIWLNRSCLIFQLSYKHKTDTELLASLIQQFADSKEFFIQKAIGWSLRQLGKHQAGVVFDIINNNELKPLSKREALKHLKNKTVTL